MAPHHSQLGAKLGPRITKLVVDAQADHLRKTAKTRARIEADGRHAFWRDIGAEKSQHLSGVYDLLRAHPEQHPAAKQMLDFMATHRGELAGMLTERTIGTAAATGIGSGLAMLLAPANQLIMREAPFALIGVGDAAQAVVGDIASASDMAEEALLQGMDHERFAVLTELARSWPDLATALDLWRRGLVDQAQVELWLHRAGYNDHVAGLLTALKRQPIAPADAALMVLRGIIDQDTGRGIGAEAGITAVDFDRLTLATGEPPGAESLMEALRRGFIDRDRFSHGIRQSRIRDEWIDTMLALRFEPMATADAVEAVVRGYLTPAEGQAKAVQNGLEAGDWPTLLLAHGRPPGLGQMQQLLNRGLVSQEQVDQAVRESDIKDKYVGMVRGLRWRIPAERLVVTLVQHNAMSTDRAHELLQKDGYEPDVAGSIIKAGAAQRTAGHKAIALGTVLELYEAHALTEAQASEHIAALGYPPEDVPLLLRQAELRRELKWREAAIGVIRTAFVGHHITAAEAAGELSAAGVPAEQVSYLTRLWEVERAAHRKSLTEAQVIHAMRAGHITQDEAIERLQGQGYGPNDARFLAVTSGPLPKGA